MKVTEIVTVVGALEMEHKNLEKTCPPLVAQVDKIIKACW